MAGFDGNFIYDVRDRELLEVLSGLVLRRARRMHVRWALELGADGFGRFEMDGNTYQLDILIERLSRDLATAAEAVATWRPANRRRMLANGLVDLITRWRFQMYERYERTRPAFVPNLRGKTRPVRPAIFDVFPHGAHGDLWPRLSVTADVMSSWVMEEVAAEVVLEEMHTAAELMLTRLWGRAKTQSFAELVAHAATLGIFERADAMRSYSTLDEPGSSMTSIDLLLAMKDRRKVVKHRAGDADEWLRGHFWSLARQLENLSVALPSRVRPVVP